MKIRYNVFLFILFLSALLPCRYSFGEELRIGTTLALTGAYANYGRQALHGIELAVEEANSRGEFGVCR